MATTTGRCCRVVVAITVLALACCAASAPSPAPKPSAAAAPAPADNTCLTALYNMSDCLTFVEDGSKAAKPDKGCCPEVAGLVEGNPICLCQLLSNPDAIGIKIDISKALKLPSVCGVSTPPVSTCAVLGYPVSLPPSESPSPSPSSGGAAPVPGSASPTSDDAAANPSASKDGSGASGIEASALTFIFGLATTVSFSIFF